MKSLPATNAWDIGSLVRGNRILIIALLVSFIGALISCSTENACVNALGKLGEFLPGQTLSVPNRNVAELLVWLAAISIGALHFYFRRTRSESTLLSRADFYLCLILCAFASVAYLFDPSHIPWQATADECYFIELVRKIAVDPTVNSLGMCQWWHWPSGIFILYCHASKLLGAVSFENLRFLSALTGLAICPLAYIYFRCMFAPASACAATMLVVFNNALIAYCRVAQQHAACVILELVSLILLFIGQRRECQFLSYLGGVFAGLGFYVYYPSRITILLWLGFAICLIFFSGGQRAAQLRRLLAISVLGFAMTVLPMTVHILADYDQAGKYTRDRIILIPEGMIMQRSHWSFNSDLEAYLFNLKRGLITFNSKEVDGWGLYENPYLGFADPITGTFLWIGLIAVLIDLRRKIFRPMELFQAGSFMVNYVILCFIANIAPSFARLFVALPFITFLAVKGMRLLTELLAKFPFSALRSEAFARAVVLSLAGAATLINLWGFSTWVSDGLHNGEDYGSTLRYIMSRSDVAGYNFYILTSDNDMYIPWARSDEALTTMLSPDQHLTVISAPDDALEALAPLKDHCPFTAFMLKSRWDRIAGTFKTMFPHSVKHQITTSPYERVGIEVY
jgi:hypothetical protein